MPRVTALHPERRDRVRVELDGLPWRTLPAAAVVEAGLRPGIELDRPRARELRRAVARSEALSSAAAALSRRDHSVAGLDAALERRGVPPAERDGALATMARLRYLDDERFAHGRAAALAERNYGDEAIRFDLEAEGLEPDEDRGGARRARARGSSARAATPPRLGRPAKAAPLARTARLRRRDDRERARRRRLLDLAPSPGAVHGFGSRTARRSAGGQHAARRSWRDVVVRERGTQPARGARGDPGAVRLT